MLVPPKIILNQSYIRIRMNSTRIFTISPVITSAEGKINVIWLHDGVDLDLSDPRITVSNENALTVTDVQASDRGVYTVTASTTAVPEGVMASVNVIVDCKLAQLGVS